MITIHTNYGSITIELDLENTPNTAKNFLAYVENKFYDGTIFHRVIKGFMIQGGGFTPGMTSKKVLFAAINNEADHGQSNKRGTIAMARTADPHSASSQFFINVVDNTFLDFKAQTPDKWGYCAFGKVIHGMDVADKIAVVATTTRAGHNDVPVSDVIIEQVVKE